MALDNAMDLHNIPSTHSRDEEDEDPEHVSPPDEPEFSPDASDIARMNRMRVHSERMRLHQSFERRNPLNIEIDGPLMPPVPESRDYTAIEERRREIQRGHIRDLRRIARRHPQHHPHSQRLMLTAGSLITIPELNVLKTRHHRHLEIPPLTTLHLT